MITPIGYDVDFILNNVTLPIHDLEMNFGIKESLYEVFPKGIFTISDFSGMMYESLVVNRGSIFQLNFGEIGKTKNNCSYIISNALFENTYSHGHFAGDIDVTFMHHINSKLVDKNTGYKNTISTIIRNLLSNYNLSGTIINDTSNDDLWFQMAQNDFKFIVDQLLPNAYSRNNNNSPFFFYIGCDNIARFVHLQHLLNQNSKATYNYKQKTFIDNTVDGTEVIEVKTISKDYYHFYHNINKNIQFIDRQSGEIKIKNDTLSSHVNIQNNKINIIDGINNYTSNQVFGFNEYETSRNENVLGQINYNQRKNIFVDELFITSLLNSDLHAGDKIVLNLHYDASKVPLAQSNIYSGEYIIEEVEHIYSTKDKRAYSNMKIGRTYIPITENNTNYVLTNSLLG